MAYPIKNITTLLFIQTGILCKRNKL